MYNDQPNPYLSSIEKLGKRSDVAYSLGSQIKEDGELLDVVVGSPAYTAGIGPGMKLVAVNSRAYSRDVLMDALRASKGNTQPIELLIAASASKESQACIRCHQEQATPLVVQQWAASKHATSGIGCYECHQATKDRPDSFEHYSYRISVMVTPKVCGTCHAQQTEEFENSHHALAGQILGSLDNVLGDIIEGPQAAVSGCAKCHGSVVKVLGNGKLDPTTWPNEGIGRINPDGSKGSCSVCRSRHTFSWQLRGNRRAVATVILGRSIRRKKSILRASMALLTAR